METETVEKHSMIECHVYRSTRTMLIGEEKSMVNFFPSHTMVT